KRSPSHDRQPVQERSGSSSSLKIASRRSPRCTTAVNRFRVTRSEVSPHVRGPVWPAERDCRGALWKKFVRTLMYKVGVAVGCETLGDIMAMIHCRKRARLQKLSNDDAGFAHRKKL